MQQKGYSQYVKGIGQGVEAGASAWVEEMRWLLQGAMALKRQSAEQQIQQRGDLERKARELLQAPRPTNAEEKVRRRLEKQRDHLFTFLDHKEVDATNNLAERQLRPAVIARKVSCGNKTAKGAHTWEILTSLAATCAQEGKSFANLISQSAPLGYAPQTHTYPKDQPQHVEMPNRAQLARPPPPSPTLLPLASQGQSRPRLAGTPT